MKLVTIQSKNKFTKIIKVIKKIPLFCDNGWILSAKKGIEILKEEVSTVGI